MRSDAGPVISAKNLGKTYRLFGHPGDRIREFLSLGSRRFHREFTALQDVSFEIGRGETVGIIGRNGSGKSTLLQLIAGILKPTSGSLEVRGRVSALLELGAGFSPEFTGRENVYFQGAVMGYSRPQMDTLFDEIAAFADIGDFVDQPVRIYSSGMFLRLAFATAVHVNPDILVIDEALAVGDAVFQAKCFERMKKLKAQGATILFVSHSMPQILSTAESVLLMEGGRLKSFSRDVATSIANYESSVRNTNRRMELGPVATTDRRRDLDEKRFGNFEARLDEVRISQDGIESLTLEPHRQTELCFYIHADRPFGSVVLGVSIREPGGRDLWGDNNLLAQRPLSLHAGLNVVRYQFSWPLVSGEYLLYCGLATHENERRTELDQRWPMERVHVLGTREQIGVAYSPVSITVER